MRSIKSKCMPLTSYHIYLDFILHIKEKLDEIKIIIICTHTHTYRYNLDFT